MRLLKVLLILVIIVFPFGELLRFDIGDNIRFKLIDIFAGFIMLVWILLAIMKKVRMPKKTTYYFAFPLIALVSLLINSYWLGPKDSIIAGLYLVRWLSYLSIFFAVLNMDKSFKKILHNLLIIDGLIIVVIGYFQYFFFSDLKPLFYLGWDDHMYRLFSVYFDPNFTGGILVLYLLFLLGLLFKQIASSNSYIKLLSTKLRKKHYIMLLSIFSLATLVAIFLTFSRSSLLMLLTSVSLLLVLLGRKKLIAVLIAVVLLFGIIISPKFNVENINLFRQTSTNARLGNYQVANSIILQNPIVGVGFNAYRYAKERYKIQTGWTNAPSHADAGVDNSLLFVLATAGIAGLITYLLLWAHLVRSAWHVYGKHKNVYALVFLASSAGLFVHAMFINSLFFPAIMIWMWILFGLMEQT